MSKRLSGAISGWLPGRAATLTLLLLATLGLGCDSATEPTGATAGGLAVGEVLKVEGSVNWATNSVSWTNAGNTGSVPVSEFGFVANSLEASTNGPSHFFFSAPLIGCNDLECFPGRGGGWVDDSGDLKIEHLSWSPSGAEVTFEGNDGSGNSIYVMAASTPRGSLPRELVGGEMPSFSRDGSKIVFVTRSGAGNLTTIRWALPQGGGGELITGITGAESPRLSPGDSLMAWSGIDGFTGARRILVWDTRRPEFQPVPISDPDAGGQLPTRDGNSDEFPTWSPNSSFIAYKSTIVNGNQLKDGIHIATVGERTGPGAVRRVVSFEQGAQLSFLRWHPDGKLLLFILDNDVFVTMLPESFWDS